MTDRAVAAAPQPLPDAVAAAPQPLPDAVPPRGLSLASLVLAALGLLAGWALLGAPSIVAVVLGHLALSREPAGRPLATVGLVLGYLGILTGVVGAVLIAIALSLPFAFLATYPVFTSL